MRFFRIDLYCTSTKIRMDVEQKFWDTVCQSKKSFKHLSRVGSVSCKDKGLTNFNLYHPFKFSKLILTTFRNSKVIDNRLIRLRAVRNKMTQILKSRENSKNSQKAKHVREWGSKQFVYQYFLFVYLTRKLYLVVHSRTIMTIRYGLTQGTKWLYHFSC